MSNIHVHLRKNILWLILDRLPLNSLTIEMVDKLTVALRKAVTQSPQIVVLTGMGEQAFCSGIELPSELEESHRRDLLVVARETCVAFEELKVLGIPTVALVKGTAFGAGCELAALCDTLIAREDARFRLPAVNAKVFPCAISHYLPAAIGQEQTMRLMQSGETLLAKDAWRLGLAHQVLPKGRFLADAEELLIVLAS